MRPLVPEDISPAADRKRDEVMRTLVRSVISAAGTIDHSRSPQEFARQRWGTEVARSVDYLIRGAVSPATTTTVGWATELAPITLMFLASLRPVSAGADVLARGLQLRFNGAASILLPTITTQAAQFVGEGKPIPIAQFQSASGARLDPRKLALIATLTHEMISSSNAEAIVRACLVESAALGLDAALFSASAGSTDAPAGLLNGVAPMTASTATPFSEAAIADLGMLGGAIARVAGNNIVFVCAPEQALAVRLHEPLFNYPVLASRALPAKTVIAIAADALVSAFDTTPMISASRDMEAVFDTAPGDVVTAGGVVGAPVASIFQSDRVALKMRLPCGWILRSPSAIAFTNATTW
jgi:hypothetical protein